MNSRTLSISGIEVLPRLSDYVDRYAGETPAAIAVVCGHRRIDYDTFQQRIDETAKALMASGVTRGDRVAMLSAPSLEFWQVYLASTKIGAIWVGLNPRYSVRECHYVITDAEPSLLIGNIPSNDPDSATLFANICRDHTNLKVVAVGGSVPETQSFAAFLNSGSSVDTAELEAACRTVETGDPCLIVYTSGSTGEPKGAVLSHYGLSFGATMQTQHFGVEKPSMVVAFPINHVACVADTCATTLVKGGKIVFQERFDARATVVATASEHCTIMGGVPTMYQMQLAAPEFERTELSRVEFMLWGGAAMPKDIIAQLQSLGTRLKTAYGMTETATHVTYTADDADLETLANTVGKPDPNCQIRIAKSDADEHNDGESGEIQIKADFLMTGYWRREAATRNVFTEDGWFRTGDVGFFRADGNLCLVGRLSDMFKSGGYNVYPREIETVIEAHPGVALAAVVAVPDPLYQEVGCAWVKRSGAAEVDGATLDQWCRSRLANYKIPKTFRVVNDLPLLPVGKVDKRALKASLAD